MILNLKVTLKSDISNVISDIANMPLYIGECTAISSLNRQFRHHKLEMDIYRERKMILQYSFFVRHYF